MKILITIIKANQGVKDSIIYKKINGETLFDIIFNKLIPEENNTEGNRRSSNDNNISEDDLDITNLLNQLTNDNEENSNFIKIEDLSEIIHIFNSSKKEDKEEIISDKVSIEFKNYIMACLSNCTKVEYILKLLKKSIFNSFQKIQK